MLKTNVEKRAFIIVVQQGKKVWEQVVVAESEEAAKLICKSKGWNMLSEPKQAQRLNIYTFPELAGQEGLIGAVAYSKERVAALFC